MLPPITPPKRTWLELESLEGREVPAITILVDYTLDLRANGGSGFFESNPQARAVLDRVAEEMGQRVSASLAAINPGNGNTWTASIFNPVTGGQYSIPNLSVAANTIVVYAGARAMPGGAAGVGGYGGYSWSGSATWGNRIATRGWDGFSLWGGSIAFDTTENWHFGLTTTGLDQNEVDFYSVATHEFGHILGIGTAPQWFTQVQNGSFIGSNAVAVYGGPIPLTSEGAHWADGVQSGGQAVALDPVLNPGTRVNWTPLDQASLHDVGWAGVVSPPASPPPTSSPPAVGTPDRLPVLISRAGDGTVHVYVRGTDGNLIPTGQSFTPFAGFTGTVRTAVADFTGDGVVDYAFATGGGTAAAVRVIDGRTGADVLRPTSVLGGFTGGAFVAAGDLDRDGRAELVVSADAGGYPTVEVYQVAGGTLTPVTSFLAFSVNSRRGVRVAMGDMTGDGADDLIVGSGPGGLPRVILYDGSALSRGTAKRLGPAFLAFDRSVRAGMNVAAGDVDGDGHADLVVSQDRGGSSETRVWSGAVIASARSTPVNQLPTYQQFFANGTTSRDGIRAVVRDIDGDGKAEVVTSAAEGSLEWVRVLEVTSTAVQASAAVFPFVGQAVTAGLSTAAESDGFDGYAPPGGPCLCCRPSLQTPVCERVGP